MVAAGGMDSHGGTNNEVKRQEIQAAISKAVELRAIHAALVKGSSPASLKNPSSSSSPVSRPLQNFSAQDYPVFTPSYEDEPMPGHLLKNPKLSETWDDYGLDQEPGTILSENYRILAARHGLPPCFDSHVCPSEDQKSVTGSSTHQISVLQTSPQARFYASGRRNHSLSDCRSVSSCNRCRPALITAESDNVTGKSTRNNSITVVPLTDSHSSLHHSSQPRNRGLMSWLFPRFKKKTKNGKGSPNRPDSEEVSQVWKELGVFSMEKLKRELFEAKESRDAALMEVSEMKSSLGDLNQKLEYLEKYCEGLKKALKQATSQANNSSNIANGHEKLINVPRKGNRSIDANLENFMPVTEEAMVEGFLQIVSEARLSAKQFCRSLIAQIDETDDAQMTNVTSLLQPHKLSTNSKHSKTVQYHLEAIINQALYEDFENRVFQKNGTARFLDPEQDRQAKFSSFVALRNLSWNEVIKKGTKYYSEDFSKFCDQKMSLIITTLNWTRPWPEQLLQAFFVAAKCIWLLHLLAFSFDPAVGILRVEENRSFDANYMEDVLGERQRSKGPSRVKVMVMPGFYVNDRILRCKVLCRYKSMS